ncbi:MAG TPA: hypothetical protein VLM78_06030 [Anaerolineales bacterium]|nr:hypothetical protein [Anaerolineales bacterium]
MASKFNCPNCGGANEYAGEGNTVRCQFCGSDVPVPSEMVNQVAQVKLGSKARTWLIIFVIVVFVLPTCIGLGGTLIGVAASIIGTLAAIFASFFGG